MVITTVNGNNYRVGKYEYYEPLVGNVVEKKFKQNGLTYVVISGTNTPILLDGRIVKAGFRVIN
jgi:hypothetical protein